MATPAKDTRLPGCPTCTVTVDPKGKSSHSPNCVTEDLRKHRDALHKIGHILKEIGITIVELPVDIAMKGMLDAR